MRTHKAEMCRRKWNAPKTQYNCTTKIKYSTTCPVFHCLIGSALPSQSSQSPAQSSPRGLMPLPSRAISLSCCLSLLFHLNGLQLMGQEEN